MAYTRILSPIERYYISCDLAYSDYTPCLNQMTLEGTGDLDIEAWQHAVAVASQANPGSRLVLRGHLGFSRWVDSGKTTPFRIVDDPQWDGLSDFGAAFLRHPLPAREGPTSEVLLVRGTHRHFVVFRTHHGVMDGRGTQAFADDVFRVLRGIPPVGENSNITDLELAREITQTAGEVIETDVNAPTGLPDGNASGSVWQRLTLQGSSRQVLAKVAIAIGELSRSYTDSPVRVQLPVDMRGHQDGLRSTANLSGGLVLEVTDQTDIDAWTTEIKAQLAEKKEAQIPRFVKKMPTWMASWVPLKTIHKANLKVAKMRRDTGMYRTSAIVSNLGLVPLKGYVGGGFTAQRVFFIPPEFDTTAFFLTLSGHQNGMDLVLRTPRTLATQGRLGNALAKVAAALADGPVSGVIGASRMSSQHTQRQKDAAQVEGA